MKTVNTAEPTGLSDVTAISANNAWAVGATFSATTGAAATFIAHHTP